MNENFRKLAKNYARLYIQIARAVADRCGQKGVEAIRMGLREYALERGARIRKRVDDLGLPPDIQNYYEHFDNPLSDAGFKMDLVLSGWNARGEVSHCPFAEIWKKMGEEELGQLYCQVDYDMLEGYNPVLRLERSTNILKGDKSCVFNWSRKGKSDVE